MAWRSERKAQGGQQALAGRARIVGGARDALSFGAKRRRHYPDIAARYWKSLILPASSPIANPPGAAASAPTSATSDSLTGLLEQVQALKLQAQTTQQTLLTLRREDEESSAMPNLGHWDTAQIGTAIGFLLALAVVWWALWRRPQHLRAQVAPRPVPMTRQARAGAPPARGQPATPNKGAAAPTPLHKEAAPTPPNFAAVPSPVQKVAADTASAADWSPASQLQPMNSIAEEVHESHPSIFARPEPVREFDPAAAADEVQRVRQSLARKREARHQFQLEGDDSNPDAFLPSQPSDLGERTTDALHVTQHHAGANELDFSLPDSPKMPNDTNNFTNPKPAEPSSHHEVVLALALESESLELWQEARELAQEVLDGGDAEQMIQAQMLINRLDARESS